MPKILVLYYSSYGHTETLAEAEARGARSVTDTEVTIKRVPELVPEQTARQSGMKLEQNAPIATPAELADYDGILFGTPTRYGQMAAQMRNFIDQTGSLWVNGSLIGKPAGVFSSTATQHGGQETTIVSFHTTLLHLGMVVVGVPYSCVQLSILNEVSGGSPYGAGTLAGVDGKRMPSANELAIAEFQGKHFAQIAAKLAHKVASREPAHSY